MVDKYEEPAGVLMDIRRERISERAGGGLLVVLELSTQRWRVCNGRHSRHCRIPLAEWGLTFNLGYFRIVGDLIGWY